MIAESRAANALADENARLKREIAALIEERDARQRFIDEFTSVLGHDLRSPLSAIVMATALLGKTQLDERGARALMRIHTSSRRAERLIRDLVDCARARLGAGIPLARDTMDLQEAVRQIVDELALTYPERRVTISVSGPTRGSWDFDRVSQLTASLLGWAARSAEPETDVRVEIDADDAEARLLVHSRCAPIDAEILPRLFEPFARTDEHGGKSDGLALYVVAAIARAHGGDATARSSAAEGTTIIVRLPR